MIKKIVVLGPESTGKSTLCAQLANHYNALWVKEFAREYLMVNGTTYTFDDLLQIAREQLSLEEKTITSLSVLHQQSAPQIFTGITPKNSVTNDQLIFIDTNMYVLKVWCEFVFDKCHHWILNQIAERKYDLYLLCDIDLPWVQDELREYPDLASREKLYHHYKDIMVNQSEPWVNIKGNSTQRLQKAIEAIEALG